MLTQSAVANNSEKKGIGAERHGILARVTGLEPATSGVTGRRSDRLSYTRVEPTMTVEALE